MNDPVFAGYFSLNGNGEMTGTAWVEESGFLEGPIVLTNTHSVGVARDAVIAWRLAHGGPDASGYAHPGLPWAGCTLLGGIPEEIAAVRSRAVASEGVLVADMPASAQTNRVYDGYLAELAGTKPEDLGVSAFSVFGPRNRVDKLIKKLTLL